MTCISIITPAYNAAEHLQACADSILAQSFTDFEWIVINDGSTDSTLQQLQTIAANDVRVKVFSYENQGVSTARNLGLEHASGDYFAFIDADDVWHPQLLEIALESLKKSDADLVSFTLVERPADFALPPRIKPQRIKNLRTYSPIAALKKNHSVSLMFCNKLYKKTLIGHRFPTYMKQGEDHAYIWAIYSQASKVARISNALYYYRINPKGATNQALAKDRFDCTYNLVKVMRTLYVDSPSSLSSTKTWILKRIASMCFKTFILKTKRIKDSETKDIARSYLDELTQDGTFLPTHLPIRKRLIWRKHTQL